MSEHSEFMPIDIIEEKPKKNKPKSILYDEITTNITNFRDSVTDERIEPKLNNNIVKETMVKVEDVVDKVEEVVDKVEDVVDKVSLANTLQTTVIEQIGLDKCSIPITPEIKKIFKKLLDNHTFFDEVEQNIKNIVLDDKINSNDVPQIISLISNLYKQIHKLKIKFNEKLCGDILKIVFEIAIKEKIIKIKNNDIDLLECVNNIIDTSISLMLIKKELKTKGLLNCILNFLLPKK